MKEIEQQRESAIRDFEGLDKSFADLHQRYLKLKQSSDSQQQVYRETTITIHQQMFVVVMVTPNKCMKDCLFVCLLCCIA